MIEVQRPEIIISYNQLFHFVSGRYCDYNATTPLPQSLIDTSHQSYMTNWFNPSSKYYHANEEAKSISKLRNRFSKLLVGKDAKTVICASATEAINQAIYNLSIDIENDVIITTDSEHSAVKNASKKYFKNKHLMLSVEKLMKSDFSQLEEYKNKHPNAVYFIQSSNNETGIINPIKQIREILGDEVKIILDASQSFGKQPDFLEVFSMADALILSPHKFYGPKGVGILIWSDHLSKLLPLVSGGGQQAGLRGGTENAPLMKTLSHWLDLLQLLVNQFTYVEEFRNQFEKILFEQVPDAFALSSPYGRIMNTSTVYIPGVLADELISSLDEAGIMAASGSACNSGSTEPSQSYLATGLEWDKARCVVRFSFGYGNLSITDDWLANTAAEVIKKQKA